MNHSKLPWKEEKFENNYRGIVDADDRTVLVLSWNANKCDEDIALIVKACNEHDTLKADNEKFKADRQRDAGIMETLNKAMEHFDTLKAKADLFDELREYVTRQSISDDSVVVYSAKILRKVEDILSKAKEIK